MVMNNNLSKLWIPTVHILHFISKVSYYKSHTYPSWMNLKHRWIVNCKIMSTLEGIWNDCSRHNLSMSLMGIRDVWWSTLESSCRRRGYHDDGGSLRCSLWESVSERDSSAHMSHRRAVVWCTRACTCFLSVAQSPRANTSIERSLYLPPDHHVILWIKPNYYSCFLRHTYTRCAHSIFILSYTS